MVDFVSEADLVMAQWLQGNQMTMANRHGRAKRSPRREAGTTAGIDKAPDPEPEGLRYDEEPISQPSSLPHGPDLHSLNHILAMTREMKKLAQKAGLMRVALILEMAELEAMDSVAGAAKADLDR